MVGTAQEALLPTLRLRRALVAQPSLWKNDVFSRLDFYDLANPPKSLPALMTSRNRVS
jgi:hypothetical protein